MTEPAAPLIELAGVRKNYAGVRPLRIARLVIRRGDRVVLTGLDAAAAETFVHLVTGAALADEGDVRIGGKDTRAIATDTEWLASLDGLGLVSERAVLLDSLPIAASLALPLTLAIDPMSDDVRRRVEALAEDVGLRLDRLAEKASTLSAEERVRVHLARALAQDPAILILEHPTARIEDAGASAALGSVLQSVSAKRDVGWVALTADERFARASGGTRLRLEPETGQLRGESFWRRFLSSHKSQGTSHK
jgi:ABC-type sugar transport system ATPase subunit